MLPLPLVTQDYYRVILIKGDHKQVTAETILNFYQCSIIVSLPIHIYLRVPGVDGGYWMIRMLPARHPLGSLEWRNKVWCSSNEKGGSSGQAR